MRIRSALAVALLIAAPVEAGDVTAVVKNGTLTLRGDDGGADLLISPPIVMSARGGTGGGGTTLVVTPQGGTTLNGVATPASFDGVESVKLGLGSGPNAVTFDSVALSDDVSYKGGAGTDQLLLTNTSIADDTKVSTGDGTGTFGIDLTSSIGDLLSVKTGSGADSVTLDGGVDSARLNLGGGGNSLMGTGSVGDDFSFKGTGNDSVDLSDFQVGSNMKVKLGSGAALVTIDTGSQIGNSLKLKSAAGADTLTIDQVQIGDDASFALSNGDNTLSLTNSQVGGNLVVKAGSGNDTVSLTGTAIGDSQKINLGGGANTGP
jgi:hypothetical protein